MAGNVVVTQYVSLDGVIEDPVGMEGSGLGDWTGPFKRGPKGDQFKHEELFASTALLLGRKTYEGFAAGWPTVKDEAGFADRINRMPKYVASRTMMVFPTVLGRGKTWFAEGWKNQMRLLECSTFGSGIVLLRYAT